MSPSSSMTTVVKKCEISPPPGAVSDELYLPLTLFDIVWLRFHPVRSLLFHDLPCSKQHFMETILPKLIHSLSTTLERYFPLAGNLLEYTDTEKKPMIRYVTGDSVLLTVSESRHDFDDLVGHNARDSDLFYDFVTQLPPPARDHPDYGTVPLLAVQVTLFPDRGISFGFTCHHAIGDASSFIGFIRAWAETNKLEGDDEVSNKQGSFSPFFDRSVLKDPLGIDSMYWDLRKGTPMHTDRFLLPTNKVRATFTFHPSDIKKLKDLVISKRPSLLHVSSFVVTAAYMWTCLAKSLSVEEGKPLEYFMFAVDCRARLDPPLPSGYFGNCLSFGIAKTLQQELVGEEGLAMASEVIVHNIKKRVNKGLRGAEKRPAKIRAISMGNSKFTVSGSPKFDLYGADFGWGKARKVEILSIDEDQCAMSLFMCRDLEGGLEVGLSLKKMDMDAFAGVFADGIKGL